MLTAKNSALVAGGATSVAKTIVVRILRPFLMRGERIEIGKTLEVARALGAELISAGKAERVAEPPPAAAPARAAAAQQLQPEASKAPAETKPTASAAKKEP